MLKTALSPRWLAGLALAIVIAGCFGFLARWQWSRSHEAPPPPASETEKLKPLDSVYTPGTPILGSQADHLVEAEGSFDVSKQAVIADRLQSGDKGYWIVAAFHVKGRDEWIPVVRGWSADSEIPPGLPEGTVKVSGRLIPPEAPLAEPAAAKRPEGTLAALSPAELANLWDEPLYDAFLVSTLKVPADAPASLERVPVGAQPQETAVNWLNVFYAVEWMAFATVVFFMWYRLVKEDYIRQQEDAAFAAAAAVPHSPSKENS